MKTLFQPIYLIPPYKSTYQFFVIKLTAELRDESSDCTYFDTFTCEEDAEQHPDFVACHYSIYGQNGADELTHISDCGTPTLAVSLAKSLGATEQIEPFDVSKQFDSVNDAFVYCHQYEYPLRCIEELAQYNIGTGEYGFACELLGYFK